MLLFLQVLAITTDNASNNNTFIRIMADHFKVMKTDFNPENQHVRCLAHVLNLAVQDMLESLKTGIDIAEVGGEKSLNALIPKLRKVVAMIRSSPQRREKLAAQCSVANIKSKELVLDVKTRWNSTYAMITRALELSEVRILRS